MPNGPALQWRKTLNLHLFMMEEGNCGYWRRWGLGWCRILSCPWVKKNQPKWRKSRKKYMGMKQNTRNHLISYPQRIMIMAEKKNDPLSWVGVRRISRSAYRREENTPLTTIGTWNFCSRFQGGKIYRTENGVTKGQCLGYKGDVTAGSRKLHNKRPHSILFILFKKFWR